MKPAPSVVLRPKFAHWLFARSISYRDAAPALGTTHETLRRVCLPFGNVDRRVPSRDLMPKIVAWTAGAICPGDFYEPELSKVVDRENAAADEDWAHRDFLNVGDAA